MAIKINSANQNQKRTLDLSKLDRVARITLKTLGVDNAEVNIVFLSNQAIRELNRKYLRRDRSTDVIAFIPGEDPYKAKSKKSKKNARIFMGDIAISPDKAEASSIEYGTTFREELALYVIHGVLHLAGYKDTDKKSRKTMRKKEDELLQKVRRFLR